MTAAPHLPDCREEDWLKVPEQFRWGLRRYLVERLEPGSFLSAVLRNDLAAAVLGAGCDVDLVVLRALALFLHNHAPNASHGTQARFDSWLNP